MEKRLVLGRDGPEVNSGPILQVKDPGLEMRRWHR
jgi:hypothetical protein